MRNGRRTALTPSPDAMLDRLYRVGRLLDLEVCWLYQRRYHFVVDEGGEWTIAISPESAGRIRVEACKFTRPVRAWWAFQDDAPRLAALVREAGEAGGVRVGV